MPGWISPDDVGSVLYDIQARLRRLESYNAAPINSPLMQQVLATGHGAITSPNTTTFTTVWSSSFTLAMQQSVLVFASLSDVSNTGASPNSNYQYLGLRIDGSAGPGNYYTGAVTTVGEGVQPVFLMAIGKNLAPGTHTVYLDYAFDAAGNTTSTVNNMAMYGFIIGA